jgi:hypothetical protein
MREMGQKERATWLSFSPVFECRSFPAIWRSRKPPSIGATHGSRDASLISLGGDQLGLRGPQLVQRRLGASLKLRRV